MNLRRFFSFNTISIMVGVAGFLSAIITMFVNTSVEISVKWLIMSAWLCMTIVVVLAKVLYDVNTEKNIINQNHEIPIKYVEKTGILIIKKNDFFTTNSLVGCYHVDNEVETISFVGWVHHVQENLIQVKIAKKVSDNIDISIFSKEGIKNIIIRPVIPLEAFSEVGDTL